MTEQTKREYPHYHPTEGYGYGLDMTPEIDWWPVTHVVIPEGRFLNDNELKELFILSHRLTPENIKLMKKYDRDNKRKDRFKPHHNGRSDKENLSLANSFEGSKEYKINLFKYLTGKISSMELDFLSFREILIDEHKEHQKNG